MPGRRARRPSPAAAATKPSSPRTVTTALPMGLVLGTDFVTPAVDAALRFHLSASGRRLRPASGERDPSDDSPRGRRAIHISQRGYSNRAGRACRSESSTLGGKDAQRISPFQEVRPYFAILCLPPFSRILGTVLGRSVMFWHRVPWFDRSRRSWRRWPWLRQSRPGSLTLVCCPPI